jgi:exodeoxyribonuclease VII small subunit
MPKKKTQDFESSLKELEEIIYALEKDTVSLEESIQYYKKGMDLAAYCSTVLKKAEQEVYIYEEESFKKWSGEDSDGED